MYCQVWAVFERYSLFSSLTIFCEFNNGVLSNCQLVYAAMTLLSLYSKVTSLRQHLSPHNFFEKEMTSFCVVVWSHPTLHSNLEVGCAAGGSLEYSMLHYWCCCPPLLRCAHLLLPLVILQKIRCSEFSSLISLLCTQCMICMILFTSEKVARCPNV